MIEVLTYHYGRSATSRTISQGQKLAGHWDESLPEAPSHILISINNRYYEANWGQNILPFFPFWRKNRGVRELSVEEIKARSGVHRVYSLNCDFSQIQKAEEIILEKVKQKIEYDFLGLIGATKKTMLDIIKYNFEYEIQNKYKYFCSELVAEILSEIGIEKTKNIKNSHITPALLVKVFGLKDFIYL